MMFLSLFLTVSFATMTNCPFKGGESTLRRQIESSMVDLTDKDRKSGFIVKVGGQARLITAHHNVTNTPQADEPETQPSDCKKFADQALKDPQFSMLPWSPSQLKIGKFSGKHWGKGQARESFQFQVEPGQFNYSADLVSVPSKKSNAVLEVAQTPPQVDEEILVAGFPEAKAKGDQSRLVILKCKMKGYRAGVNTRESQSLAIECPEADFDIGGMSGGAMISLCSGKAVGAVSGQDYDEVCPKQGNPNQLIGVPVGLGPDGNLELGLQRPLLQSQCISTTGTYGLRRAATIKKCQVLPPGFDLAPANTPKTVK